MGLGSSDRHTSGCQESWEKTSQWLGLAEGSRTWRKKGFCSPPPEDWQELACPGAMLSFSLLSIRAEKKKVFSSCQDPMAVRWTLCWSLQGPGSHASPPFDGCAGGGQPRGSLPRPGGLASLGMYICSTSGPNCCAGKELSMPVSRQPAFWDWRGGRRPGRAGQPRLMRKCHWEFSVFFCFSLQRALFVPSLSPADPNPPGSLLLHNTGSGRSASGFLPVHLIPREPAPPFPNSLEEGGREAAREPGSCPRGTDLMRFLPRGSRSQARIYSLCPQKRAYGQSTQQPCP